MATTYDKIATTTLGSAAANITFSSIANSWTDLRMVITVIGNSTGQGMFCQANSDTGTNYSATSLSGDGSAAASGRESNQGFWRITTGTYLQDTYPSLITFDLFSYAGSTYKTGLVSTNTYPTDGGVATSVQLWRSTSAITSLSIYLSSGNLKAGTTATLYGIKSA